MKAFSDRAFSFCKMTMRDLVFEAEIELPPLKSLLTDPFLKRILRLFTKYPAAFERHLAFY
jgi:hypothetical protein